MAQTKLRVAIVGCGQIADAHLQELRYVPSAELVGVCDRHLDLARQAAARFEAPASYDDLGRMLVECRPDVVHVTTPPQTHKALALQALDAGAHVYIEKPFTVDAAEAQAVFHAAEACSRLVCVGHDQLFDPIWERVRGMVSRGELGRVIHVDSIQGYNLEGPFGRMLAADPNHWVLRLPGGLFQNTISHALYRITDLLTDQRLRVWATWFRDPQDSHFPTELRVLFRGEQISGHLLFSSRARPLQKVARIQGSRKSIEVDLDAQVIRQFHGARLPGVFGKIEVPFRQMSESARWLGRNLWRFLRSDIHYFGGMRRLFTAFYQAILTNGPPPIPYEEIHRVSALMDEIFQVCQANDEPRRIPRKFSSAAEMSWTIPQAAS